MRGCVRETVGGAGRPGAPAAAASRALLPGLLLHSVEPPPAPAPPRAAAPAAIRVPESYTLERAYILFSTMGLRHLVVVDEHNRVRVGGGRRACSLCPQPACPQRNLRRRQAQGRACVCVCGWLLGVVAVALVGWAAGLPYCA